ncbi:MAG TPA: fibronectin type III domain-containing protein, partial [Terriglobales bacterium]|nr:fibronectin type III domain-containing protein [Terriglobales bacterium]
SGSDVSEMSLYTRFPLMRYGFRNRNGKAIVAYWLAAHSQSGNVFPSLYVTMSLKNTGIVHPVVVDVTSGEITPAQWKQGASDTLEMLPVKDSIVAITDESYFDWPVLPEAPSSLTAAVSGKSARLTWEVHGGDPKTILVERKNLGTKDARWEKLTTLPSTTKDYVDAAMPAREMVAYRVRAANDNGSSAYSNIVRISSK